ncbi:hypothetical protein GXM_02439 [Nostoc sphaeroides CCNUC1]|uniref:Uncharacterized protein n=1 Tax=Nostoc sphaeroides CCNUC1 TaxID=2653204 RepID=A0A5P8VX65_9NOSO|nr:hypothetical protein GXM_02439 [Nostoc sphaeroides CCNUC1]
MVWGKGYWGWVKGFFFPFSPSPFPLNREVLGLKSLLRTFITHYSPPSPVIFGLTDHYYTTEFFLPHIKDILSSSNLDQ